MDDAVRHPRREQRAVILRLLHPLHGVAAEDEPLFETVREAGSVAEEEPEGETEILRGRWRPSPGWREGMGEGSGVRGLRRALPVRRGEPILQGEPPFLTDRRDQSRTHRAGLQEIAAALEWIGRQRHAAAT